MDRSGFEKQAADLVGLLAVLRKIAAAATGNA
jgi:hypothetical protein